MEKLAIGIDIGGTNTAIGLVDKRGDIITEDVISTRGYKDVDHYVNVLVNKIKELIKEHTDNYEIEGIGIGAPNGNYYSGCIEFAPNLEWKGVIHLVEMIKTHFNMNVMLTNDANAGAMGEMIYGGAKGMTDFIYITLGTGVGSGIVSNGKLIYGHDGFAGEIGHTIAIPDGRLCGCGRKGCLETYTSATGIVKTAKLFLKESIEKSMLNDIKPEELNSKSIYDAALKGDELSLKIFDYTTDILGKSLADSIAYTSPEAIFLFGGLAQAGDLILKPLKVYLEKYVLNIYKNKVKILPSELKEGQAAVIGAAALIWNEI